MELWKEIIACATQQGTWLIDCTSNIIILILVHLKSKITHKKKDKKMKWNINVSESELLSSLSCATSHQNAVCSTLPTFSALILIWHPTRLNPAHLFLLSTHYIKILLLFFSSTFWTYMILNILLCLILWLK